MSPEVQAALQKLRADYESVCESPFKHFFCPILWVDEPVELCMGHIVNDAFPASSRRWVVQRKDIDNFFGRMFEAEFEAGITVMHSSLDEVLLSRELKNKVRPKLMLDGVERGYYFSKGYCPQHHTPVLVEHRDGGSRQLVVQMTPEEMRVGTSGNWSIAVEGDFRVAALVSLIKSAFLTMFRMLGYRYALSAAGVFVGRDILGRFLRENRAATSKKHVHTAAREYFREFTTMVRPVEGEVAAEAKGTPDDFSVRICEGVSGRPFAIAVHIKTGPSLQCVLLPVFDEAEAVATYLDFMRNSNENLSFRQGKYDPVAERWMLAPGPPQIIRWPKSDGCFDL